MVEQASKELIENVLAKRLLLQSIKGIILRENNRDKYNWLFSVYFDPEISDFIKQAYTNKEVLKDLEWVRNLITRLHILSKDSTYPI